MAPIKLAVLTALAGCASALLVAEDSPCSQNCGNVLSSTTGSDMTCVDSSYSSKSAGIVFETCIGCELKSNYSNPSKGNQTDMQYLLYNLRYALSYCVFGQPDNSNFQDNPCITTFACEPFLPALQWDNFTTDAGSYDYCQSWDSDRVSSCNACLGASGGRSYLRNYMTILDAACSQKPAIGSTVSVDGSPFSTYPINITAPTPTSGYSFSVDKGALDLGGKVGVAVGGFVFLLIVAGFFIVCNGHRRRRAFLRRLEKRNRQQSSSIFPSPGGQFSSFDTPLSQKPLRSWDDNSPSSAMEQTNYTRYFSPYSSQFNSPVSATESPAQPWPVPTPLSDNATAVGSGPGSVAGWTATPATVVDPGVGSSSTNVSRVASRTHPTMTQEEYDRMAHEHQLAHIGIAMGGSDPSLRNKNSNLAMHPNPIETDLPQTAGPSALSVSQTPQTPQAIFQPTPVSGASPPANSSPKGKARDESYELREIDRSRSTSNSTAPPHVQSQSQAPSLAPSQAPSQPQTPIEIPAHGRGVRYPRPPSPIPYDAMAEEDVRPGRPF